MSFQDRYQKLNADQKRAVDTIDGAVMVVAGPGTGKTELLSVRAANILQKTDTLPENILCLTFTESGQAAMRERLVNIIGKDAYKVAIHTFHSFGSEIMAQNREYFYRGAQFQPADDIKQYEILRGIFEELEFSNPLSTMMNGEYTYLPDAKKVISELKRNSALTSDELIAVINQNDTSLDVIERLLIPIAEERVGKTTAAKIHDIMDDLHAHAETVEPLHEITPLAHIIVESLETMLVHTEEEHPTKPISAWKSAWLERDASKKLVFKDRKRLEKLKALAYVYFQYLNRMEQASLYDFDDMIMQVVHSVEVNQDLKFNLQEKYLYIMVDEFQDTNAAQLRILHALTDNPVHEGNPNILAVGDDDQAIYGFQGADVSNILNFNKTYPQAERIVLTNNYRSGENILTQSRQVIQQGGDRLERIYPELNKQLSANKDEKGTVALWQTPNSDGERLEIINFIKQAVETGADLSSIAVLARKHADIQSLLPYFKHENIPVRYEKEESVLDSAPIVALEACARLILILAEGKHDLAQTVLPTVLAHPAWKLEAKDLWRLSLTAYTNRQNWMEVMAATPEFTHIHEWLVTRAQEAQVLGLEPMIDRIIGRAEKESASTATPGEATNPKAANETFSPYFDYFFSPEVLAETPEVYVEYLEAIRAVRAKLRDYQPGDAHSLKSFIEFIDLHRRLGITISITRYSLARDVPAVQLLTAHKSKGLEFDTVFVYNSVDSIWGAGARTMSRLISYPANLPLAPAGSTADERLRLFYVAMTRAKNTLIMTHALSNDSDKQTLPANFLVELELPPIELNETSLPALQEAAEISWYEPLITPNADLHKILAPQLEKFKLSATSLNSFLDVTRGGPKHFLLNNLLHFPQTKQAAAGYGTAIHWTMQQRHTHMAATGEEKPLEDSLHDFEQALAKERLDQADYEHFLQQGSNDLPLFINSGVLPLAKTQKAEVSFGYQDVRLGDARISGALDMIDLNKEERTVTVTDYKTGHPAEAWDKGADFTKIKLHKYRQQLIFYKILLENSAEYSNYTMTHGQLAFIEPTKAGESILLSLDLSSEDIERTKKLVEAVWKRIQTLDLPDTSGYSEDLKGILAFEQDLIDGNI